MATGKELTRTVTCGIFKNVIENIDGYCSYQIYSSKGVKLTPKEAAEKTFCHLRVLFKDVPQTEIMLIKTILDLVASTSCESMGVNVNDDYNFQEVVVS